MRKSVIKIPEPKFGSHLTTIVLELEKLRTRQLTGEIPPYIFFQLKEIFQMLETLGSARIEGNKTTLAEYVEKVIESKTKTDERQQELYNLEQAIDFIEQNTNPDTEINRAFISELHKIVTKNLTPPPKGEGSKTPGKLREHNVKITQSNHVPPDVSVLQEYFDNFIRFINEDRPEQYQLLMVAIAHHRFNYMHPFDNGNGRVSRLLNYALLIKLGFKVQNGRIINPSAVFYSDRDQYYEKLSKADSLKDDDVLEWAEYFLLGLKNEIEKIDSLLKMDFVNNKILLPAIKFALESENITPKEFEILKYLIKKDEMAIKAEELEKFELKTSLQKSRAIRKLRDKNILQPTKPGGRIYTIRFANSYLLRGVIHFLEKEGFVSDFLNKN